jgi:hypothetical protein
MESVKRNADRQQNVETRRLVNDADPREQPLEILQQKISVFEEPEHAQIHANAGNEPPALSMRTLRPGNLPAEPKIHAGSRKKQRGEWRIPRAVKNVARQDQQVLSQLPAVKAPVERHDNCEKNNKRERVEKHCGRRLKRTLLEIVSPDATSRRCADHRLPIFDVAYREVTLDATSFVFQTSAPIDQSTEEDESERSANDL